MGIDLRDAFIFIFVMGIIITVGLILLGVRVLGNPDVKKSDVKIQPELELTVKDNVIDTVYVYRF